MSTPSLPRCTGTPDVGFSRRIGAILAATSVLMVVFMAMHPVSHAHSVGEFAQDAARGIPRNALVHGVLVTLSGVMLVGYVGLGVVMGVRSTCIVTGLVAAVIGTATGMAAGLINGFVMPNTAASFAGAESGTIEAVEVALAQFRYMNQTCAQVCVIGMCTAMVSFSTAAGLRKAWLLCGVGVACGVLPLAAMIAGQLPMTIVGFGSMLAAQAIWGVSAGVWTMRRPREMNRAA